MSMELDRSEIDLFFEGAREIGAKALEYMAMDFWGVSVEKANIRRGTLRDSIQAEQQSDDVWTVGTNLEYASYVHEGTDPHEIFPLGKQALYWEGASHPVKSVYHPGYEGNPWFDTAADIIEERMDEYLEMAIGDLT